MAEEDNSQKCSDRSSFVSVSVKKPTKQRKVPQRGLGVAQLEKIRLDEQNKKIQIPPKNSTNSSSDFKPNEVLSPSSPSPTTIYLPLFRPPLNQIDVQTRPNLIKNTNWWNAEFSESNSVTPNNWPTLMHRSPFSSSMVNVSSGTSSSSVMSYQIEPPSNQSYCGSNINNYSTLMWPPDERMMVGMTRPYSFCMENAPGPCFPRFPNPPSTSYSHISRPEELASCSYGLPLPNIEPPIPVFREMPSGIERNPKRNRKDNSGLNGDFLTLGPPATMQPQNWRPGHFLPSDIPEFESLHYKDPLPVPRPIPGTGVSTQQRPYISFLPPVENQNAGSLASSSSGSSNGEIRETAVDLNLKL